MNAAYVDRLRDALQRWERSLQTPLVPGELSAWAEACRTDFARVADLVASESRGSHEAQYKQMFDEDPELAERIEQLRAEDDRLFAAIEKFAEQTQQLIDAAEHVEPDERKAEPFQQAVAREGLGLVLALRAQEVAIETWFVEALERDRGNVD